VPSLSGTGLPAGMFPGVLDFAVAATLTINATQRMIAVCMSKIGFNGALAGMVMLLSRRKS
jgi:hypothetical protein